MEAEVVRVAHLKYRENVSRNDTRWDFESSGWSVRETRLEDVDFRDRRGVRCLSLMGRPVADSPTVVNKGTT